MTTRLDFADHIDALIDGGQSDVQWETTDGPWRITYLPSIRHFELATPFGTLDLSKRGEPLATSVARLEAVLRALGGLGEQQRVPLPASAKRAVATLGTKER